MSKSILTERSLINIMRKQYLQRLVEVLEETDVFDDRGNMILGKDLKVKHKKTQYEYTVDDVYKDQDTGEVMIALRLPEEPRFSSPPEEESVISDITTSDILGEDDLLDPSVIHSKSTHLNMNDLITTDASPSLSIDDNNEVIFVINQDEFEKDYEVK